MTLSPSRKIAAFAALMAILTTPRAKAQATQPTTQSTTQPAATSAQALITDFGAVSDGKTLNTTAIQKAIDHLAASGGGTLVVPQGVFLTGAIFLKPAVNLRLDKDAVLKGSTDTADYPTAPTRIEGHVEPWLPALVNADGVDHLNVSGEGTLDGSGQPFWTAYRQHVRQDRKTTNLDVPRPRLMFIENCANVKISGIHFKDSGYWNLHLYRCHDVLVDGLDVSVQTGSPGGNPSTDGMDIDSSQNVTVRHCTFSVGDDCIALKGTKGPFALQDTDSPPVENIHIEDCVFHRGGGVTFGSEATIVRNVLIERCEYSGPGTRGTSVLRLKLRPDTPQDYEDVQIKDITLDGMGQIINVAPWKQYFDLKGQPAPTSKINNVTFSNIKGTFGSFGGVQGNAGDVIENMTFRSIDVKLKNPQPQFVGVTNLLMDDVTVNGEQYALPQTPPTPEPQ